MIDDPLHDDLRAAASTMILAKRDRLLDEHRQLKAEQVRMAERERELDRELAECRAAAKFFNVEFDMLLDPLAVASERDLKIATRYHSAPDTQQEQRQLSPLISSTQYPSPLGLTGTTKMPKVRDMVLDQLRAAGEVGKEATPIQRYIELTYSAKLHAKTVGMTLYRLSQEQLVYRKGKTWFYGREPSTSPEKDGTSGVLSYTNRPHR